MPTKNRTKTMEDNINNPNDNSVSVNSDLGNNSANKSNANPSTHNANPNGPMTIAGAIIIVGILIALAIFFHGKTPTAPTPTAGGNAAATVQLAPVTTQDHTLGNPAKVTLVEYADYQCPFCGKFFEENEQSIINNYVNTGKVELVYRDYAFLGPESTTSAEAAWCAGDQGKFWQYHDYLFNYLWTNYYGKNKEGENVGAFSDANLKSFAQKLGLDTTTFNSCLDSGKYAQAVSDATALGTKAGVQGTPKGFILVNGKTVSTIDGAEALATVTAKLDAALK
jgi:protein-disulfide isomerase